MAAPPLSAVSPVAKDAAASAAKLHLDPAVGFADGAPAAMAVRPLAGGVDGFVATAVLTHEECASLVAQTEGAGYTFWHPEDTPAKRAFRSADTVEVHAPDLAEVVWRRVRAHVTQEVRLRDADDDRGRGGGDDDDGREPADDRGAEGTWQAYGVNPDMLFARYEPGGHFAPHTDGSAVVDFNDRSLFSLLVYLTTAQGGGTRIVRPGCDATIGDALTTDANGRFRHSLGDEAYVDYCPCTVGNVLVFRQTAYHEGEPVVDGPRKYLIRTDVMYRRVPAVCADTPRDLEAFRVYREAMHAEAVDAEEACKLYQRVVKLSPSLAGRLGL